MAIGGVLYTVGAVIFALGRPNPWPRVFGFHEIFHVFVILAAVAHFVAMAGWIVMHEAETRSTASPRVRRAPLVRCCDGRPRFVDQLAIQLLHPAARPPARTRAGDAAYDLACVEAFTLAPGERAMIPTGIAVAIPPGMAGSCCPAPGWRSGTASRASTPPAWSTRTTAASCA